jgi:hypothetical protein
MQQKIIMTNGRWGSVINTQIFERLPHICLGTGRKCNSETSPINEEALIVPGAQESWTWKDLLSSVMRKALGEGTLIGTKLRTAFPLWAVSSVLKGPRNGKSSYLVDITKLNDVNVWFHIKNTYIAICGAPLSQQDKTSDDMFVHNESFIIIQ